jgi:hypothetical protein
MKKNTSTTLAVRAKSDHPTPDNSKLTSKEQTELKELEKQITDNYQSAFTLAAALAKIHDQRLYRAQYKTFAEYCKQRWDYSRSYCERLAAVDDVMNDLKECKAADVLPRNEVQARVFVNLNTEQRLQLAEKVSEEVDDKKLTASIITKFKKQLFPDKCASASKKGKVQPVIDVEASLVQIPTFASLVKALKLASDVCEEFEKQDEVGELYDLLKEFIKSATPLVGSDKQLN